MDNFKCGDFATVDILWITFRIFHYPQDIHRPKVIHSLYTFYPQLNQTPSLAVHPHYVRTCHYYNTVLRFRQQPYGQPVFFKPQLTVWQNETIIRYKQKRTRCTQLLILIHKLLIIIQPKMPLQKRVAHIMLCRAIKFIL